VRCQLRGRLKHERQATDLCVVGDEVEVAIGSGGEGSIEDVLPRRSRFSRQKPGKAGKHKEDVLVANLDQVVVVMSFGMPPFRPRLLDRFLVIAEHNAIGAVAVVNKLDLAAPGEEARFGPYERIGYPVVLTSAAGGRGIDALRGRLSGKISAFAGQSGAGKSSLLNALEPGLAVAVGETSAAVGKGRHTTRHTELHPLAGGGWVADTPGIRELATWRIPEADLDRCFVEMRPHLGACAFGDCTHAHEPDCPVKAAVAAGDISPERYDSYLRLLSGAED